MEFRVLGPLEVVAATGPIRIDGARQRRLLALLLLRANEVVAVDRLVDGIWGDSATDGSAHALEAVVWRLRSLLDDGRIEAQAPGYRIRIGHGELDLQRFDQLVKEARRARSSGDPPRSVELLDEAIGLWRGPALTDIAGAPHHSPELVRLEELRLSAVVDRLEVRLTLGQGPAVVAELESLVAEYAFHEALWSQLMRALYQSGRQADALRAFGRARAALVQELGIEPGPDLQALQVAILNHDPQLDRARDTPHPDIVPPRVTVLAAGHPGGELDAVVRLAIGVGRGQRVEVIATAIADHVADLASAVEAAAGARRMLEEADVSARAVGFVSGAAGADIVRLSEREDVALVLVGTSAMASTGRLDARVLDVLDGSPADVGVVVARAARTRPLGDAGVVAVPFGGSDDDWAALELGVRIGSQRGATLRLIGVASEEHDAPSVTRLLADASLLVQRVGSIVVQPRLAQDSESGLIAAMEGADVVLAGVAQRWRDVGLGSTRARMAMDAPGTVVFVRRGLRPGLLAPPEQRTSFTWSLGGSAAW